MKSKILTALLLIAVIAAAMTSCFGRVSDEGTATVVIENRDGSFDTYSLYLRDIEKKDEGVTGLLEQLAGRNEAPLALDMQDGPYGKYINSIGSLTPNSASGEYIAIYTSVESDFDTSAYVKELTYKETLLKTSGLGISSMQVPSNAVILFRIESFS